MTTTVPDQPRLDGVEAVADIEQTREALRGDARALLGVVGDDKTESFRRVSKQYGLSYYPLFALGLLFITDSFQTYAFTVLTPEISRSLGVSIALIGAAFSLQRLAISVAPLPVAALSQGKARRAMLCILTGFAWSLITLFSGFVTSVLGLLAVLVLDGLTTGSVTALHTPLVMESYHPSARVRAVSIYHAFGNFGNVAAPALVGVLAGSLGFTWRGVFLFLGLMSVLMTVAATGLRDPGFGKWDTQRLRASVHEAHGEAGGTGSLDQADVALGVWGICRRLLLIPTNRRGFPGVAVAGAPPPPPPLFLSLFLLPRR